MTRPEGWALGELAERVEGRVEGDPGLRITGVAAVESATAGTIVRAEKPRYLKIAEASTAAAILTDEVLAPVQKPCIRVKRVRLAFSRLLELFAPAVEQPHGVHPTAVIGADAQLGTGCAIGPYAVVGKGCRIAAGAVIHPHAVIGQDSEIGEGAEVFPHAVLYPRTILGARSRVHSGAVIGADGFGYEWSGTAHEKVPQIGRVRIGDDVEIGANTTIDRATTGDTVIGPGTKIDNLVQIAHNIQTGAHCIIIAQAGIAGSTRLGNGVIIAGQAGLPDHVTIGDGAQIAAKAGVWGDVQPGLVVAGHPARPIREDRRIHGALSKLPELLRRVTELERAILPREEPAQEI
jgi:UDP-3-O-[3-hydroxymyristoyl] glucosamine N-acyltransferase